MMMVNIACKTVQQVHKHIKQFVSVNLIGYHLIYIIDEHLYVSARTCNLYFLEQAEPQIRQIAQMEVIP